MGWSQDITSTLPKTMHCSLLVVTLQSCSQRQAWQQGGHLALLTGLLPPLLSSMTAPAARNPPRKSQQMILPLVPDEPFTLLCKHSGSCRKARSTIPETCLSCTIVGGKASWIAADLEATLTNLQKDAGAKGASTITQHF